METRSKSTIIQNITINNLPDDCLFHVFSFLSVENRLRSTAVCRRWRDFESDAWPDVKKLDLITLKKSKSQHIRLLELCGGFLKDLTVSVPKDSNIIRCITANCSNLIKFRVQFEYARGDKRAHCNDLSRLFAKNKVKLRTVVIDNMREGFAHHSECLLELPEELVELQLWGFMAHLERDPRRRTTIPAIPFPDIIPVLGRLQNLEVLVLSGIDVGSDEVAMIRTLRKLKCLEVYSYQTILCIDSLTDSRKLEYLSLRSLLSMSDDWVTDLVKKNPGIKHLKLTRSYLSDVANEELLKLSKLETLSLRYCLIDSNFHLSSFRNLKKLIAKYITIIILLETALELEFLWLASINSPKVLKRADKVVNRRENNIPLHIVVPDNLIQQWRKPERISPLLRVESSEDYRTRTVGKYSAYDVESFY